MWQVPDMPPGSDVQKAVCWTGFPEWCPWGQWLLLCPTQCWWCPAGPVEELHSGFQGAIASTLQMILDTEMTMGCYSFLFYFLLDRSLMIGWRTNSWNPERVSSVFTFVSVCVSVCLYAGYRAHLLTYEPNFWVKWSLGHEKKTHFFVFRNFHFYAFYRHFSIFSLYNTSKFLFSSYRS